MTRAGTFGLPQSGGLIIVRPGAEPLRVSGYVVRALRKGAARRAPRTRELLRQLVAMRKPGGNKR